MKSISKIFLIVASLLAFASCDKIDEDKYTIFAGVAGDWYTTDADIPHVQRAFIEKYTGVRCIFCPKADDIIHDACNKYGDSVVVVAVPVYAPKAATNGSTTSASTVNPRP